MNNCKTGTCSTPNSCAMASGCRHLPALDVKLVHPDAPLPVYGSAGAACFDLAFDGREFDQWTLTPGESMTFTTGLEFEVPAGWAMKVYSRSGHGFKHGLRLVNGVGIIDADYRGEVRVGLRNDGAVPYTVTAGERIAQAMLVPAPQWRFRVVSELSYTARGAGGFGSTGR